MPLTIRRLPPQAGVTAELSNALAEAAGDALQELIDDATVSFSTWDDGEGLRFVCRVETAPADPIGGQPPWRFWSGFFSNAGELRSELERGLAHRLGSRRLEIAADGGIAAAAP